jgi:SAM-dependent methyltransferase
MVSRDEVIWCYRAILGREPESEEAIARHCTAEDFAALRACFFASPEFLQRSGLSQVMKTYPLDHPDMEVEYQATPAQLAACLRKIKEAWTHLGHTRPHHSVLTNKSFLPENLENHHEAFWSSGEAEALEMHRILARHGVADCAHLTAVEYGCGVGRVTMALARRFAQVHAYDISSSHLALARQRAESLGVTNCHWHLCADTPLAALEPGDVFYSRIVFQHNPPPVIYHLIENALRALKPSGIAIFQVPTYHPRYGFLLEQWLAAEHAPDVQMHCLPAAVIFRIIAKENCIPLEVREDSCCGGEFLSQTFVVRRLGA